jgi:hypothetical protein
VGAGEFKRIYSQAAYWIGFRRNASDAALREREEELLLKVLGSASSALSTELFEPIYAKNTFPDVNETTAPRAALREKCLAIVYPKAAEEAIDFFRRDGAINTLFEGNRFFAVKCCLFKPDSPIWRHGLQGKLIEVVRSGRQDLVAYVNVRDFFRILVQGLETGIGWIQREDVAKTLSNEEFVQSVWETIIARGIQYRMQISFIRGRELLIQKGVREELLPLTQELRARVSEEKSCSAIIPV